MRRRQFTSDNQSGICPEAWGALAAANIGHTPSYGNDDQTSRASDLFRDVFETDCDVYFVSTGTAANSLALASLCQSYHSVICHETAHIQTDECGAPEFFSNGTKLLVAAGAQGKLTSSAVRSLVTRRGDIHYPKPRVLSLTQSTELGTVYTPDEIGTLCAEAKQLGLSVQMDGSRFANAVAHLGCSPAELTWKVGVDVLCLGGTKNGMLAGEAVVFFDRRLSLDFAYRCKQAGQLVSKMRFTSAQWLGLLDNSAWLRHAANANAMATALAKRITDLPGVRLMFPVQSNAVFVDLDESILVGLRERGWVFYCFIGVGGARFVCSWDTTAEDVAVLASDVAQIVTAGRNSCLMVPAVPMHGG